MTNEEIIADIAINIYGEDKVMELLKKGLEIPLHTLKGWEQRGPYRIKRGEHGIETKLWKKKKKKKEDEKQENSIIKKQEFYLCKAYLFKEDQVELIEK